MAINPNSTGLLRAFAAATNITSGESLRLMGISATGGSGAAVVTVYNALTATGSDLIIQKAAINDSTYMSLGPDGTQYATGLTVTVAGTGASFVVFYVIE